MSVASVVFDVGETLLDDSREFGAWADWIGVPRHTFSAVLGAVTAAGRDNADTFQYFRPGFNLAAEREFREQAGAGEDYEEADFFEEREPHYEIRMLPASAMIMNAFVVVKGFRCHNAKKAS